MGGEPFELKELDKIIKKMRETILKCGGEIHFNSRISNIITKSYRDSVPNISKLNGKFAFVKKFTILLYSATIIFEVNF